MAWAITHRRHDGANRFATPMQSSIISPCRDSSFNGTTVSPNMFATASASTWQWMPSFFRSSIAFRLARFVLMFTAAPAAGPVQIE